MSILQRILKPDASLVALFTLVLVVAAPNAGATPLTDSATWLSGQLGSDLDGSYCASFSASATVGLTADCTFAFDAAGGSYDTQRDATYAWAIANMDDYVGSDPCGVATSLSASAVAKLALLAISQGDDPTDLGAGHRDLIADLQCMQDGAGRFSDVTGGTDFSTVFGQSIALTALVACEQQLGCVTPPGDIGDTIADGAAYLRGQQCADSDPASLDGAFRSPLGLVAEECNADSPFTNPFNPDAVDVDSTGVAAQALLTEGSMASTTSAEAAVDWLATQDVPLGGPPATSAYWRNFCDFGSPLSLFPSVNSTAQATMAYVEAAEAVVLPQAWLADAVTESDDGMPACTGAGSGDLTATTQGVVALAGESYPSLAGL
jgi:hypothetical protein